MNAEQMATFFTAWLAQADWQSDSHKFYKSLGHAIASARSLPDVQTVQTAIERAYQLQHKQLIAERYKLMAFGTDARTILSYLRATT